MNKRRVYVFAMVILAGAVLLSFWFSSKQTPSDVKKSDPTAQVSGKKERKILYYVDPMNPSFRSDKPGKAPDGMDLTPVYADDEDEAGKESGTLRVSGKKQQLINLKIVEVSDSHLTNNIRTVGTMQYDETKVAKIHSKIEGWIEKVHVDYVGRFVRKGQPMFSIYSPELVATQQEYLLAVKAVTTLKQSEFADVSSGANALRASAYRRLKLWDVSDEQIKKLEETGEPMTTITFYSPVSGFVLTKNVFEKMRIDYDTEAYSIADLSTVWMIADIYEYEAARVRIGQRATMTLAYESGRKYEGTVTYIYPDLNNMTRTLKARIEFKNSSFDLKPGMYANVEIDTGHKGGLVIPVDAVLDSGDRKIVFVQKTKDEFEPREVELGDYLEDQVVVTKGLKAGEKIVASGNFLIDSESQLKSALESMSGGQHAHGQ
ncbi:MAG TPA: efflux RND transporter periplasmic adaptor subunit [Acidobacteriota bacterium]|nr:efflux RND transporter periplasmic adaptor subunit [Acidobacteriota bacterium]